MKSIKYITGTIALSILCSAALAQEHISPIPFPKSNSAGKLKIIAKIKEMNKKQKEEADDCVGDNPKYSMETTPEVVWDSPSIYSILVREDDFCGGAHPNAGTSATTFDATTGNIYSADILYQIRESLSKRSFPGEHATFYDNIGLSIENALIDRRKPFKDDDDCLLRIQEAGPTDNAITYADLALGKDGLYVYAKPAHDLLACYDDVVLPYSKLAHYLNEKEAARLHLNLPNEAGATASLRDLLGHPSVSENRERRAAIISVLSHDWSKKDLQTLAALQKAKDDFFSARAGNEAVDDGIPSELARVSLRDDDEDDFLDTMLRLDTGFSLHNSYEVSQVDTELNNKYQKIQQGDELLWDGSATVSKAGVQETERLWIAYRNAWMRLIAAKAPDTTPASVLFELTQHRLDQLSDIEQLRRAVGQ
jgi:uncharacterized protein YecT (DUF1311 family)